MKKFIFVFLLIILSTTYLISCKEEERKRELNVAQSDIALLSIFSDDGTAETDFIIRNYGHAFLAVTNLNDEKIIVGDNILEKGETITLGIWNITDHFGVWYNVESNYIKEYNKYPNRYSLTIGITEEDLNKINNYIEDNDTWNPLFNCSKFALQAWNLVAETNEKINEKFIVTPEYLVEEISKFDTHEKNKELITDKDIRYYKEPVPWEN